MGAEQSKIDGDATKHAFHVLRVDGDSPASAAKLCPYFDYITSVNGVEVVGPSAHSLSLTAADPRGAQRCRRDGQESRG